MTVPTVPPRTSRPQWQVAVIGSAGFVALLWVLEILDHVTGSLLDADFFAAGVRPRSEAGLSGIVLAPLLHDGFAHLAGNSVPLLVLGFVLLMGGVGRAVAVTAVVWVVAGVGVWLFAPGGFNHLGASVVVFGWLAYLLLLGIVARDVRQVLVGVVLLVVYGSVLWGVLPGAPGVSWQGHLFGAAGGVGAAVVLGRRARTTGRA